MHTSYKSSWEVKLMLGQNRKLSINISDKIFAMSCKTCAPIISTLEEWKSLSAKYSTSITKNFWVIDSIQARDQITAVPGAYWLRRSHFGQYGRSLIHNKVWQRYYTEQWVIHTYIWRTKKWKEKLILFMMHCLTFQLLSNYLPNVAIWLIWPIG